MIRRDDYKVPHEYRFTRVTRVTIWDRIREAWDYIPYFAVAIGLMIAAMYAGGAFGGDFEGAMNRALDGEWWTEDTMSAKWVCVSWVDTITNCGE